MSPEANEQLETQDIGLGLAPKVSDAVLISFYDGNHKTHSACAHILAVGPKDVNGKHELSIAFPDPAASPAVLASPVWHRAFHRVTGVKHHQHPKVLAGQESMCYCEPFLRSEEIADNAPQIEAPAGDGSRPYFKRPVPAEAPAPSPQQAIAVQTGALQSPTGGGTSAVNEAELAANAQKGPGDSSAENSANGNQAPIVSDNPPAENESTQIVGAQTSQTEQTPAA